MGHKKINNRRRGNGEKREPFDGGGNGGNWPTLRFPSPTAGTVAVPNGPMIHPSPTIGPKGSSSQSPPEYLFAWGQKLKQIKQQTTRQSDANQLEAELMDPAIIKGVTKHSGK
ncbi:hypothetical protein niasHT_015521 [Heterodera trifolii]|uniref:Uncharacterized protein n=1 Tax=Heterodera trifolii TaxID=157864 RepID=A0ABD2L0A9_9BILA